MTLSSRWLLAAPLALAFAGCDNKVHDEPPHCEVDPLAEDCIDPPPICDDADCLPISPPREGKVYAYLAGLSVPAPSGASECCEDLDGVAGNDNRLAYIYALFPALAEWVPEFEDIHFDELLNGSFENGGVAIVVEASGVQEDITMSGAPFQIRFLSAQSDSSWEDRLAGEGEFTLDDDALAEAELSIEGGIVEGPIGDFPLALDVEGIIGAARFAAWDFPDTVELPLKDARIRFALTEGENGLEADETVLNAGGKPVNYITGALDFADVAVIGNQIFGFCHEDFEVTPPISLVTDVDAGEVRVECALPSTPMEDSAFCAVLEDIVCGTLGQRLGRHLDLDTDGDGVNESLSFGVRVKLVGARVAAN